MKMQREASLPETGEETSGGMRVAIKNMNDPLTNTYD